MSKKTEYDWSKERNAMKHGWTVNTYAKDSKENKKDHLEKVPVAVIGYLEHDKLPSPVGVHGL